MPIENLPSAQSKAKLAPDRSFFSNHDHHDPPSGPVASTKSRSMTWPPVLQLRALKSGFPSQRPTGEAGSTRGRKASASLLGSTSLLDPGRRLLQVRPIRRGDIG